MMMRLNEMGSDAATLIETNVETIFSGVLQQMTNQMAFVFMKIISMCNNLKRLNLMLTQTQADHLEIMNNVIGNKVFNL